MPAWVFTTDASAARPWDYRFQNASCPKRECSLDVCGFLAHVRESMQFPQKDLKVCSFEKFYHILRMHTPGLVRVTVPTRHRQQYIRGLLKVTKSSSFWGRRFADVCLKTNEKKANLSVSSSHDLFNILKCPFEGQHMTLNGSIKVGHFEAEESSYPMWPTIPSER